MAIQMHRLLYYKCTATPDYVAASQSIMAAKKRSYNRFQAEGFIHELFHTIQGPITPDFFRVPKCYSLQELSNGKSTPRYKHDQNFGQLW